MSFGKKKEASGKKTDLVPVGALWPSKSGNGFTGGFNRDTASFIEAVEKYGIDGLRIVVFENSFAKGERDPAYKIYVSPKQDAQAKAVEVDEEAETVEAAPVVKPQGNGKGKKFSPPWKQTT